LFIDNDGVFKSQFPSKYCSHNEGFDTRNQHVPDGVMSTFNEKKKTAMRPKKPPTVNYRGSTSIVYWPNEEDGGPKPTIEIITRSDESTETSTISISGIKHVTCVAGRGKTWMAGGWNDEEGNTGAIAFSFDNGQTWAPGPAVNSGVVTIAWAPVEDSGS
jgi:hypothetical protein